MTPRYEEHGLPTPSELLATELKLAIERHYPGVQVTIAVVSDDVHEVRFRSYQQEFERIATFRTGFIEGWNRAWRNK